MRCEAWAPEEFIHPFYTDSEAIGWDTTYGEFYDLCPECALALKNEIHGFDHKSFIGGMAQQLLEDFRKWNKGR